MFEPLDPFGATHRILLVEDERGYAKLAHAVLQDHKRWIAHSARDALELFIREEPEITFLDIGLPDANGIEVLKAMRYLRRTS